MISSDDLHFFSTVAASESLTNAARTLGVTPSAVTQRLQQLEQRLRVHLINRSGRQITLTDEGELLAERGRKLLDELSELNDLMEFRRGVVSGHLKVVAPMGFGRCYVAPAASAFQEQHPNTTLSLSLSESPWQMHDASWDVLIHVGELRDSSLVVRTLAPNDRIVCASPRYVEEHGMPQHPEELRHHNCVALRENNEDVTLWRFVHAGRNEAVNIRIEPRVTSNDGETTRIWALAGMGVIMRSEWHVADDIRDGRLVRLLDGWRPPTADIVALMHSRDERAARIQGFLNILSRALSPPPWRLGNAERSKTI
jgi:DNA-binding transcriptional LysR family regulator